MKDNTLQKNFKYYIVDEQENIELNKPYLNVYDSIFLKELKNDLVFSLEEFHQVSVFRTSIDCNSYATFILDNLCDETEKMKVSKLKVPELVFSDYEIAVESARKRLIEIDKKETAPQLSASLL